MPRICHAFVNLCVYEESVRVKYSTLYLMELSFPIFFVTFSCSKMWKRHWKHFSMFKLERRLKQDIQLACIKNFISNKDQEHFFK